MSTPTTHPMDRIVVDRYQNPTNIGYAGYVEDQAQTWILWFDVDGKPCLFNRERDENGGTLDDGIRLDQPTP